MKRRYRLRNKAEIEAVRKKGQAVKHRYGILVFRPNSNPTQSLPHSRFCFTASKRVGNAVQRNRAKRLLREAVRLHLDEIGSNWDCVFIARPATVSASFADVEAALLNMVGRAGIATSATQSMQTRTE